MITEIGLFLLPYVLTFSVAYVLGFMSRNSRIDSLSADVLKLRAELSGVEIRTPRTEPDSEPVRPVQPRTRPDRTPKPAYGPEHSAARTEALPTGVQYVRASDEEADSWLGDPETDRPMTDQEYADYVTSIGRNT